MNMFAGFDENPAMTLQDIKETKRTDARTDNMKTVKIKIFIFCHLTMFEAASYNNFRDILMKK